MAFVFNWTAAAVLRNSRFASHGLLKSSTGACLRGCSSIIPPKADDVEYHDLTGRAEEKLAMATSSPRRYQLITEREDRSDVPLTMVQNMARGKLFQRYRGALMLKTAFDLCIYHQLLEQIRPKTIIELGAFSGASALWFADTAKLLDVECNIFSTDIDLSLLSEAVKQKMPNNLKFLEGDNNKIETVLVPSLLKPLPHPWLIVEDAHSSIVHTLTYLNQFMTSGDYVVCEDTDPNSLSTYEGIDDPQIGWKPWGTSKLDEMKRFLATTQGKDYRVDSFFTDFYGHNCTWHWHGFLRKM